MKGIDNEFMFVMALNRKKVKELNPLLYDLINAIFPFIDDGMEIKAWRNHYNQKTDVLIKINNIVRRISIKMGSRNSIHEEPLSSFVEFLEKNGISKEVINKYLLFHFGDGTINGKGKTRYDSKYLRKRIYREIGYVNNYFNNNSLVKKLCDRFIIKGLIYNDCIDALVYGTPDDFLWIKKDDIYKIMAKRINDYCSSPHFGFLVIQPLNRCLNYNSNSEYARYKVQLKWYTLFDDIFWFYNSKIIKANNVT